MASTFGRTDGGSGKCAHCGRDAEVPFRPRRERLQGTAALQRVSQTRYVQPPLMYASLQLLCRGAMRVVRLKCDAKIIYKKLLRYGLFPKDTQHSLRSRSRMRLYRGNALATKPKNKISLLCKKKKPRKENGFQALCRTIDASPVIHTPGKRRSERDGKNRKENPHPLLRFRVPLLYKLELKSGK